jgi:hypothetical protein
MVAEVSSECYTREDMERALPAFIERHWPKNGTAENGGPATPGRGEAMTAVAMFLAELPAGRKITWVDYE